MVGAVLANAGEKVTLIVRPESENLYPPDLTVDSKFGQLKARFRL